MSSGEKQWKKFVLCLHRTGVCVPRMPWKFSLGMFEAKEDVMERGTVLRGATEMIVGNGSHLKIEPVFSYLRAEDS